MQYTPPVIETAIEIRRIFKDSPANADRRIQSFLLDRLDHLTWPDRIKYLQRVKEDFSNLALENKNSGENKIPVRDYGQKAAPGAQSDIISRLFSLLLGKQATTTDLESSDTLTSLTQALNTIFDTLNRLIHVINTTLKGSSSFQEETIRSFIGRSVSDQSSAASMVTYLSQIEQAFLTSQQAMKAAAQEVIEELLTELDPQAMEGQLNGPLKSKKTINALKEKHKRCRQWLASERFDKRWMRAFEKSCHRSFKNSGGGD